MGEGMSKKRTSGSGQEAVRVSAEELGGSRVRPSTEKPTPAPIPSRGGEWHTRWRQVSHGNEEEAFQQNGTWREMSPARVSKRSPSTYPDANKPTRNLSGRKEDQMDLPFEDCKEVLIESKLGRLSPLPERPQSPPLSRSGSPECPQGPAGDLEAPAKPGSAEAEKRWEWNSLDAWLEPRAQDGTQSLTKATQTEAGCVDQEDQPSFHSRRDCDAIYMMDLAKSSETVINQGMKEFFGFLKILVNVPILFTLELVQFLGRSVFQVLLVGLLTAIGDQMLEPLLAALFNSILQPLMVFLLNVLCTIRNLSYPIIDILKGICSQVAVVLRAFRLVEINHHPKNAVAEHV